MVGRVLRCYLGAMIGERPDRVWLPLGSAALIDWRHIDRAEPARGATAWVGALEDETVLVRTWCEETTTHFEFASLARASFSGRIAVRIARPEPGRLRVEVDGGVAGVSAFTEVSELEEHPRTGLQSFRRRELSIHLGERLPNPVPRLSAAQAEVLEYAPESALQTDCGRWLAALLAALDEEPHEAEAEADARAPAGPLDPSPTAPRPRPEEPAIDARPEPRLETRGAEAKGEDARPGAVASSTEPQRAGPSNGDRRRPVAETARPRKLVASTSAGEAWELHEEETFVGRSKQCGIVLKSQRVSRRHASVTREPDGWFINDLGAANGVWAGNDKVDRERIEDGAEYIIGDVLLTFSYA